MSQSTLPALMQTLDYGPAPESDAAARQWLAERAAAGRAEQLFINGAWQAANSAERQETRNPASGEVLARFPQANAADLDAAVAAARAAQPGWAALSGHQRARLIYALARGLQRHSRLFAVLETLDNGKPIRESRDQDVPLAVRHFYHHAGWAQLSERELAQRRPFGVCGQIIPWNFPLLMLAWKIAPALACGNTVVLKPAEQTPLTALRFAELCDAVGLPPGVVNLVTGDGETGRLLVQHPGVDKIAFTGSTQVGREIRRVTAGSGKGLTLELGGKSPFIVFEDADLDSAIEGIVDAIWFNQGEVCCAGSRLLVQESIEATFLHKLKSRMAKLRVGDPLDKAIDMGALVNETQRNRVAELVQAGVAEGADLFQPSPKLPDKGSFFPPTLLSRVAPAARVAQEEIFGPVLVSLSFRDPREAVELANNTPYGLAASLWSERLSLALHIAPQLQCGVVWVNAANLFDAGVGFGGYKESGFGREGGREGLSAYTKPAWQEKAAALVEPPLPLAKPHNAGEGAESRAGVAHSGAAQSLDRTAKLYIGGKQKRPDGGSARPLFSPSGQFIGDMPQGNRKDIRDAVEAASAAAAWSNQSSHARAQVLYYLAENLDAQADVFVARLKQLAGLTPDQAIREVEASIARLFSYGAWADKFEGRIHTPPIRGLALALHEPLGLVGAGCPERPGLLGLVSLIAPLIALGNRVVAVPSHALGLLASDFYQLLDTSDVPPGVVNLVSGDKTVLLTELAKHRAVAALWAFSEAALCATLEAESASNLKQTWCDWLERDWFDAEQGEGEAFLSRATQVKNIWIPYGE